MYIAHSHNPLICYKFTFVGKLDERFRFKDITPSSEYSF